MSRHLWAWMFAGLLLPAAADPALPGEGFSGDRYATLWQKSPFAIATPEAAAASQDYQLVGLAQFDGISYASLIVKQTQEHFVLTSENPVKNLRLVSVRHDAKGNMAVIERDGEQLVLQEDNTAPTLAPGTPQVMNVGAPLNPPPGFDLPNFPHPRPRFHRPPIVVPPRPTNSY